MKPLGLALKTFAKEKNAVHVVIETPKCSRIKYAYDFKSGLMRVRRALPEGMMFPFNFGFIPGTLGDDGDPLDILILNEEPLMSGCFLVARLVAVIEAKQIEDGKATRNDRLVGTTFATETPTELETMGLTPKSEAEIERFFMNYNQLDGKKFKVLGRSGTKKAKKMVRAGVKRFEKEGAKA